MVSLRFITVFGIFAVCQASIASIDAFYGLCTNALSKTDEIHQLCPNVKDHACQCGSFNFQKSLALCIEDFSKGSARLSKASWDTFMYNCERIGYSEQVHSYQTLLKDEEPEIEPTHQAKYVRISTTITASGIEAAGREMYLQTQLAQKFALTIQLYILSIIIIATLMNLAYWRFPIEMMNFANTKMVRTLRRHYILGTAHLDENTILSGSDIISWFLFIPLLALTCIFMTIRMPRDSIVNPYQLPTKQVAIMWAIGRRASTIAMYITPFVILFGGKNNLSAGLTGLTPRFFAFWHRWLARLVCVEVIIHMAIHFKWASLYGVLIRNFKLEFYQWGLIAFISLVFICIQSLRALRRLDYDVFRGIHIILAALIIAGTWHHIKNHWLHRWCLVASIAIWGIDYGIAVVWTCFVLSRPWGASATLVSYARDKVTEVTIDTSESRWGVIGGEHVQIQFITWKWLWRPRPFTVLRSLRPDGRIRPEVKAYCKARGKLTKPLLSSCEDSYQQIRVWLGGPYYNAPYSLAGIEEFLLIGGGIGITAVCSQVSRLPIRPDEGIGPDTVVHWFVQGNNTLEWFDDHLDEMQAVATVKIHRRFKSFVDTAIETKLTTLAICTSTIVQDPVEASACELTHGGRTRSYPTRDLEDAYQVTLDHIQKSRGPMAVFVCGPVRMHNAVRRAVSDGMTLTAHPVMLHQEYFSS